AGGFMQKHWVAQGSGLAGPEIKGTTFVSVNKSQGPVGELADLVEEAMRTSRPILLGSRDPKGPSCVTIVHAGDIKDAIPNTPGDLNGGPGTTMATLYYFDRQNCKSPMEDFAWHQGRLKTFLENEAATNQAATELAHEFAEKTAHFWEES